MEQYCTAGTSSFGMSGVNAHMLVTESGSASPIAAREALPWQLQRFWPGAMLHHLAHMAHANAATTSVR